MFKRDTNIENTLAVKRMTNLTIEKIQKKEIYKEMNKEKVKKIQDKEFALS